MMLQNGEISIHVKDGLSDGGAEAVYVVIHGGHNTLVMLLLSLLCWVLK